jgi:flagellar hook-length control protein FliK
MTMMLNTVSTTTSASANNGPKGANGATNGAINAAAQPAGNAAASTPANQAGTAKGAAANTGSSAASSTGTQPFSQWLGRQVAAGAVAAQDATPASPDAASADAAPATSDAEDTKTAATVPDGALLAAMAMPLMPLSPAQVAQAVQAAQGNGQGAPGNGKAAAGDEAPAVAAVGQDGARRGAAQGALPALAPLPSQQSQLPLQSAQAALAGQSAQSSGDAAAVRAAAQAAAGAGGASGDAAGQEGNADQGAPAPAVPQAGVALAPAPGAAQPAADTVKLAGPPTAWRQSLQEALGDRLHLQVGNNIEQAVIRLEPPQLGRIDIAIRHSAGSLEVNISATNGEVLRQLQTVSDNLRSDLSQRQFSEVAVTVAPAPKHGATPFGDPQQQQGRGRQQGRDQDDYEPGRALAEAGNPASAFSLGGRDRA